MCHYFTLDFFPIVISQVQSKFSVFFFFHLLLYITTYTGSSKFYLPDTLLHGVENDKNTICLPWATKGSWKLI